MVITKFPELSRAMVAFLQRATGLRVSLIVTTELQLAVFPERSVTVSVTLVEGILLQLKFPLFNVIPAIPQLSVDVLLSCNGIREVVPAPFRKEVTFRQLAIGKIESLTVTIAEQLEVFPCISAIERTTAFAPVFAQVKVF